METTVSLPKRFTEALTHMLGAGSHIPKRSHGYRNYYCANVGDPDMADMEKAGLVTAGCVINNGSQQYYSATLAGCQAIGLSKAAIKRAMED
jgi:hypothetical protein